MDRDFNLSKKPVTPLVGVDVFIPDSESRVLFIKRTDNGFWCTPGGSQDLGETPEECGVREVLEETGFEIKINRLLGVFSSLKYESVNYPWKGREYLNCESLCKERNKFETCWNYFNNIRTLIAFAVSFSLMLFIYAN